MAKSYDISLSFQNIRKNHCEAVEVVITKFLSPNLLKAAELTILPRHRSERDVRNQAGIADFLNFGIKCREI
jgi:hypothetical protein